MSIYQDDIHEKKLTKKFLVNRIVDIEQSIIESKEDKVKVPNITLSNLELNKRILQKIEGTYPVSTN